MGKAHVPPEQVWFDEPLYPELDFQRRNIRSQPVINGWKYMHGEEMRGKLYRRVGYVGNQIGREGGDTLGGGLEATYEGTSSLPGGPSRAKPVVEPQAPAVDAEVEVPVVAGDDAVEPEAPADEGTAEAQTFVAPASNKGRGKRN